MLAFFFEAPVLAKRSSSIFPSGASGGGGGGSDSIIKDTMADLLDRLPENFEMITMQLRAKPLLEGEAGPFVVVALQVNNLERSRERDCMSVICVEAPQIEKHFSPLQSPYGRWCSVAATCVLNAEIPSQGCVGD